MNGTVFIAHLVLGEDGEEVEVFEAVACWRCSTEAYNRRGPGLNAGTLWPRGGARITHLGEAAAHHTRYSANKCKCVTRAIGLRYARLEGGKE